MGADAVARDAASGVESIDEGGPAFGGPMKAAVFSPLAVLMLLIVLPSSAFSAWHLMAPPCTPARTVTLNDGSKTLEPVGCEPVDADGGVRRLASLSKWKPLGTLDSINACENLKAALIKQTREAHSEADQRDGNLNPTTRTLYRTYDQTSYARCIPSNDTEGWHLLVPPRSPFNEEASFLQGIKVLTDAPLSKWGEADVLDLKETCEIIKTSRVTTQKRNYAGSSEAYLKLLRDQASATARGDQKWLSDHGPSTKTQRWLTELQQANLRALEAARCIATDDPRLK
jgi:hypothetical protein